VLLTSKARLALVALVSVLATVVLARQEEARPVPVNMHKPGAAPRSGLRRAEQADALRDGRRIDPNRASAEELELLPGVGPSLARRLVESRRTQGPFRGPADLRRVKGVGAKTLAKFERFLSFASEEIEYTTQPDLHLGRAGDLVRLHDQPGAGVEAERPGPRPQVIESHEQVGAGAQSHIGSVVVQP
jgi:competence ComEA-like helix-hairpin-helix protein